MGHKFHYLPGPCSRFTPARQLRRVLLSRSGAHTTGTGSDQEPRKARTCRDPRRPRCAGLRAAGSGRVGSVAGPEEAAPPARGVRLGALPGAPRARAAGAERRPRRPDTSPGGSPGLQPPGSRAPDCPGRAGSPEVTPAGGAGGAATAVGAGWRAGCCRPQSVTGPGGKDPARAPRQERCSFHWRVTGPRRGFSPSAAEGRALD